MKNLKALTTAVLLGTSISMVWAVNPGLEIMHPGNAHTLVRITNPDKYLLMPVEESMPDAKVDILVNGEIVRSIYVRLAANTIDYTVPLDLSPLTEKGEVLLSILTPSDREYSRDPRENVCWSAMKISSDFDTTNVEKYRPAYHHTPLYGWMNDPNGMFYKDGVWHLYYQYNPYGSKWQNMTWGHSTSPDLVHWTHQPNAIEVNGLGSIFSGSCAIDHKNTAGFGEDEVIALYTSASTSQVQSLAHSSDNGMTFTNYAGNPVIVTPNEARDPNMFWNDEIGKWNLILAGAMDHEMHIFTSPDLKNWKYESSFGKGYSSQDGVWECPDLFPLPTPDGKGEKWVLLCNLNPGGKFGGSATQYFVGDFDGKNFKSDVAPTDTLWMDYGKDHYATVTWSDAPDQRRVAIGWMSNWQYANEVPTKQFRSANTLPRDLSLFNAPDGTLKLASKPSPEVNALRGVKKDYGQETVGAKPQKYSLMDTKDGMEIELTYDLRSADRLNIVLSNNQGEEVEMSIDGEAMQYIFDRTKAGDNGFSSQFPAVTYAPLNAKKPVGTVRIFIDRSSIEIFDSEGKFAMTNLVFPTQPYTTLTLSAEGGKAKVNTITYQIQ